MRKTKLQLTKKEEYALSYAEGNIKHSGMFEYIGTKGPKYHFFNNTAGIDLFLSREEVIRAIIG